MTYQPHEQREEHYFDHPLEAVFFLLNASGFE